MSLYKIILVDDEEEVRDSIKRKVDWNLLGFEVIGSVNNGEEAMELTETNHVDVVLTDIKMPFMDGLTLCAKVKENYKNTKVVLYSGFDEFEFAREAIHLEAEEYLLKPISAKDLEKVFQKIKENLDREFNERRNLENLSDYYQKSLPFMKEQLIVSILEGKLTDSQAKNMLETYEIDLQAKYFTVTVMGMDNPREKESFEKNQMLLLSLKNLCCDYLEKKFKIYVQLYLDKIIIITKLEKEQKLKSLIYHVDQVCKMGTRMLESKVNAGMGNAYDSIPQIANSYEEAKNAYDYRILLESESQAIYIQDVEPTHENNDFLLDQALGRILHEIKLGTLESLENEIDTMMISMKQSKISIRQYQLFFMEITTELFKAIRIYEIEEEEIFSKTFNPYEEMGKINSPETLSLWLKEKSIAIYEKIQKKRTKTTNKMTEKAKQYIQENYTKSNLSVEELCNYLNVSATYFSITFKKETGMSFISYLTKIRLEQAKNLLDTTEEKSYMIAEKVGYTEANYFSYVFKKHYGVSPSKYRSTKG
ncbi:MAG: response regulator [Lachnospiraceae bacterium]|nr:response regulator [Lachnospiraceae bacterium]